MKTISRTIRIGNKVDGNHLDIDIVNEGTDATHINVRRVAGTALLVDADLLDLERVFEAVRLELGRRPEICADHGPYDGKASGYQCPRCRKPEEGTAAKAAS